jgi:diaminohydroxyphosphoribosylaminopyrimidine deaminase/5-amino-6-(5-phosphoribosylamino)uracil reductase
LLPPLLLILPRDISAGLFVLEKGTMVGKMMDDVTEAVRPPSSFMQRALTLAAQARGHCHPNPMVGCVLVKNGVVVGEGWHQKAGSAHAEAHALASAGTEAAGSTAYVTLEPCNHWGRTPPCTLALIEAGVKRVVIAQRDPNPIAAGGVEALRSAGMEVSVGDGGAAAAQLNERWLTYVEQRRPFVHLKIAMSLDGKVATQNGESRWITGPEARHLVHQWRDSHEAILVGANTVRQDNAALTARLNAEQVDGPFPVRQPMRIVLAGHRPLPPDAQLFQDGLTTTLIVTTEEHVNLHKSLLKSPSRTVELVCLPSVDGYPDLATLLDYLHQREVVGLLVEGGPQTAASFFNAGLVDRLSLLIAPKLLGSNGISAFRQADVAHLHDAPILQEMHSHQVGADFYVTGKLHNNRSLPVELSLERTTCLPVS